MILAVGQRWRYLDREFDFLVEVLEVEPRLKTKILQANKYSTDGGWGVGRETSGDGLNDTNYHGNVWLYLEGQDKPK